jgi:hypothetical protein
MSKARMMHPGLFLKHQSEGRELAAKAGQTATINKSAAVIAFEKRIDEIQTREGCSQLAEMQKVARLYPVERQAYATAAT